MVTRIFATTAMAILLPASLAFAQSQTTMPPKDQPPAAANPTMAPSPDAAPAMKMSPSPSTAGNGMKSSDSMKPSDAAKTSAMATPSDTANKSVFYSPNPSQSDQLTSNYVNHTVYSANDQNLGSVTDILVNSDGKAVAAVIGVGGFLGIGEKNVAVAFDALQWKSKNGSKYITLNVTKDQLKSAAKFNMPTKAM